MTTATLGLAVAASIAFAAPALSESKPALSSQSVFSIVDCSNASIVLRFTADPAPFADFFSAFLWGFFGQFGLERLRDLAKPITSKALP